MNDSFFNSNYYNLISTININEDSWIARQNTVL